MNGKAMKRRSIEQQRLQARGLKTWGKQQTGISEVEVLGVNGLRSCVQLQVPGLLCCLENLSSFSSSSLTRPTNTTFCTAWPC